VSKMTRLRQVRQSLGVPMSRLAARVGLNQNSLGSIERRELVCPSKWRGPLAEAVSAEVTALFDGDGLALSV
jgi:DNA-binding XRE family transcriptional regulator